MNLAIYTNILTPYRKNFYDKLHEICTRNGDGFFVLVMSETSGNRRWKYEEYKTEYTTLLQNRTLRYKGIEIYFNKNLKKEIQRLNLDVLICGGTYFSPGIVKISIIKKIEHFQCLFWSESHLDEIRDRNPLEHIVSEWIRRHIYKKFDGFLYAGELSKKFIEKYANKKANYIYTPNVVDENQFKKAYLKEINKLKNLYEKYGISIEKKIFIISARLSVEKGISKFLDLLARCEHQTKVTVLIAGEGSEKQKLEEQIRTLRIDVRLLGYKNQNEMIELYAVSDVFILPSISDPNPLSCIEALWAGLPLFLSNHVGNYPEIVEEGKNGYVFSYDNEEEAVNKLERIILADAEWLTMAGKVSYETAVKNYVTNEVAERVIKKIKETTKG